MSVKLSRLEGKQPAGHAEQTIKIENRRAEGTNPVSYRTDHSVREQTIRMIQFQMNIIMYLCSGGAREHDGEAHCIYSGQARWARIEHTADERQLRSKRSDTTRVQVITVGLSKSVNVNVCAGGVDAYNIL